MTRLKFALLLFNLHWAACGFGIIPVIKVPAHVKFITIEPCEATDLPSYLDINLDIIRGDDKALSFTASIPAEVNEDTTFSIVFDKWSDDEWLLNFYNKDGMVCEFIKDWFWKIWPSFSKAVVPNLGEDCPHPAGNYSIENFEVNNQDLIFPAYIYGLYRFNIELFDKDGNSFFCAILTSDISL